MRYGENKCSCATRKATSLIPPPASNSPMAATVRVACPVGTYRRISLGYVAIAGKPSAQAIVKPSPPIAPDFVLELKSPSDNLKDLQEKMAEYQDAGVKLGWLIDRQAQTAEIYRQGLEPELRDRPVTLDGETVLPDFELDLSIVG